MNVTEWFSLSSKKPKTNTRILLYLKNSTSYPEEYDLPFTRIIMGVFIKNPYFRCEDMGSAAEEEYYFEGLCAKIHLPLKEVIAWAELPSEKEACNFPREKGLTESIMEKLYKQNQESELDSIERRAIRKMISKAYRKRSFTWEDALYFIAEEAFVGNEILDKHSFIKGFVNGSLYQEKFNETDDE